MLSTVAKRIFGSKNDRDIKRLGVVVDRINALEKAVSALSDEGLRAKTDEFRAILRAIPTKEGKKEKLDELLPEAFAVCREAGKRVLNMRHFDVQLIGGMMLHQGRIAEMRTGEGKTLVATLPVYLNALLERGVHVVTVNDYLARRDAEWMGKLYNFLGLSVGVIVHDLPDFERKKAYAADVTYGQNNEFGFDYLRDNMKYRLEDYVQRDLYFAIVDEVDSILIDEARTPLIISGPTDETTDKYFEINKIIPSLKKDEDFTIDEKAKSAALTDEGIGKVERMLNVANLYDPAHLDTVHHVNQALRAHAMYQADVDYVVKDGQIVIVDEFTGRLMPGRRWSDGLHQAIEAKEGVKVENENQTLASITFQNYFRMFEKLGGMTGTAETEAEEFEKIYKLEVSVIPTNRAMIRQDHPDVIYRTEREKFEAIAEFIKEVHAKGQPVLAGTVSIEKSERLSKYLKRVGVPHNVLNAKQHEREAEIVKDAGQRGQVTIATNMAGRGTDIILGEGVKELGGLFIIGTERHEARRIDNQLRGRAGRQGDPGASRFYLSLEDDLMRIFASDRVQKLLDLAGMKEGEAIEHGMTTRAIEGAQRRIEGHNFDIRKHLLKYDDVMNQQRKVIYALRKGVLGQEDIRALIRQDLEDVSEELVFRATAGKTAQADWDWTALREGVHRVFGYETAVKPDDASVRSPESLFDEVFAEAVAKYEQKEAELGDEIARIAEREIKLRTIDGHWKEHLLEMDRLKEGIGFEGYAQRDPLVVYKKRAFEIFDALIYTIRESTAQRFLHVQISQQGEAPVESMFRVRRPQNMQLSRGEEPAAPAAPASVHAPQAAPRPAAPKPVMTVRRDEEKVGRNDPCPCGSGKKYKKCHGQEG